MKGIISVILAFGMFCYLSLSQPDRQEDFDTGSIQGTVMLGVQQSPVQLGGAGNRYGRSSKENSSTSNSPEDSVLIWLVSTEEVDTSPPESSAILNQRNIEFSPSLLAIRQNETISIQNSDPVYHNVFSLSSTKKFDAGRRPKGDNIKITFEKPGVVDVFCDIHSNMHAVIYVMPSDVLTWKKAKSGNSFEFSEIPEGNYELKFYALGYKEQSIPIEVNTGETLNIGTITLNS